MGRCDSVGDWACGQGSIDTSVMLVHIHLTRRSEITYTALVTTSCVIWGTAGTVLPDWAGAEDAGGAAGLDPDGTGAGDEPEGAWDGAGDDAGGVAGLDAGGAAGDVAGGAPGLVAGVVPGADGTLDSTGALDFGGATHFVQIVLVLVITAVESLVVTSTEVVLP